MAASISRNGATQRLYLLGAILLLWCVVIGGRLVQLQIVDYGDFVQRAARQQQRTIEVAPSRGIIYDRNGHELAMSISVDSVFAVPGEIPDPATTAGLLARVLKADGRELLARFKSSRTFCWVARKVDADVSARIRALNLRGIYFQKEPKRFYPKRELAAQVLGYVGLDDEGLSGIERAYDARLKGRPGEMLISVDARRRWFGRVERQPRPGQNVVLTLDEKIQYIAERELETAMEQSHALAGTLVVENPHTGEILALANRPTFNPNVSREITPDRLKDHAVSDVYEPGSTFKLVTISAALDQKLVRPEEKFDCQMGSIVINGRRIHDWKPFGVMAVSDIVAHSSDVGAIKVALRLGDERLYHYIRAYGFGQQTGIELPGETRGLAKPLNRWSKVSIGAISLGQEIGISPLQLAAMVSTIANDGVWLPARLVAATAEAQSAPQTIAFRAGPGRRVISAMTAAEMKQMMQGVVLRGTGRKAILLGYSSAGKTGTAQKVDPATGTYSRTQYIASFAGFAPVNNPAIAVAVILDSPLGGHHGGEVAAPVFQRVAQQTLAYLNTPRDIELPQSRLLLAARQAPEAETPPERLGTPLEMENDTAPAPPGTSLLAAKPSPAPAQAAIVPAAVTERELGAAPQPKPAPYAAEHSAPATRESKAEPAARLPLSGTVVLDVEQGGILVPSFLGKPLRAAVEEAESTGIQIDAIGSGLACEQSPPPGTHIPAGGHVAVRFAR